MTERAIGKKRAPVEPARLARSVQERVGANVRRLRQTRAWTQEEVAWRSRLAIRMYQDIEAGRANPTLATLDRLCTAFDVDVRELMEPAVLPGRRAPGRPRSDARSGRDILVMEADDATREALELYLERQGFEVTAAANAVEGLRWLLQEHFDLVLCSDALPDHTTSWLVEHAPAARRLDRTMLIIGSGDDDAVAPASDAVLSRPLDLDRLLRAIKTALRGRTGVMAPTAEGRAAGADDPSEPRVILELILYVTKTPASRRALRNLESILRRYDRSRIALTICDLEDDPAAADDADRVVFTPTLIKRAPGGRAWLLGDLQDRGAVERMLSDAGLERLT